MPANKNNKRAMNFSPVQSVTLPRISSGAIAVAIAMLSLSCAPSVWAECESQVDLADSLDFKRFHDDCDEDKGEAKQDGKQEQKQIAEKDEAAQALELDSNRNSTTGANHPTVARQSRVTETSPSPNVVGEQAQDAIDIVEPFTMTGGQQSAYQGLLQQMAARCPQGWVKEKEWVTPAQVGYLLHHRFRCL